MSAANLRFISPVRDRAFALLTRSLSRRPVLARRIGDHPTEAIVDALCDLEEAFAIDLEADEVFLPGLTIADLLDLVEARVRSRQAWTAPPSADLYDFAAYRAAVRPDAPRIAAND